MPVDAAGPAQWAGGVWRSAACAGNQTYQSLKGGARPSCCSRWLRRRLQPCAGPAAVHGGATASSRHRPLVSCAQGPTDANAARERRVELTTSTFCRIIWLRVTKHNQPRLRELREKSGDLAKPLYCAGGTCLFLRKTPFLYTTKPALLLSLTHVTPQQAPAVAAPVGVCLRRRTTFRRA